MGILFDAYRKGWDWQAERKYRRDPEWLAIKSEEVITEAGFITYDHEKTGLRLFDLMDEEERICPRAWGNPLAWGWMAHWWLEKHGPRAQKANIKIFWQRGRRGYSYYDVWSLYSWLSKVIADSVDDLRSKSHGYPGYDEADTPEKWDEILRKISEGFRAASKADDNILAEDPDKAEIEMKVKLTEAQDLFSKWFLHLWD